MSLDFSESICLAALNGRVIGLSLRNYTRLAIAHQKNVLCSATSAAAMASFIDHTGGSAKCFLVERGKSKEVVQRIKEWGPQAILVMVGGESEPEECLKLIREFLEELAKSGLTVDLIIGMRAYLTGCLEYAAKEVEILSYMEMLRYLRIWSIMTHTVDVDRGVMTLSKLTVDEKNEIQLERMAEYPLTLEHVKLFQKGFK